MIGRIAGTIFAVRGVSAIVMAGGVGYKITLTKEVLAGLEPEKTASFWTHLVVREDVLDLYGFRTEEELRIFELLLTVSGIGPKSAMAVLDVASVETLRSAISQANAGYLTEVSGIGKKTAEKIVLELKDKIGASSAEAKHALQGDQEAQEAMRALGYSQNEAREALRKVPRTVINSNDRLREALKIVGNRH
ncbi:MAG: Holliday junction branch migration protein RuvA [bacterium]|nr:Holliday junction branch migration protein RuvA [bacterium]